MWSYSLGNLTLRTFASWIWIQKTFIVAHDTQMYGSNYLIFDHSLAWRRKSLVRSFVMTTRSHVCFYAVWVLTVLTSLVVRLAVIGWTCVLRGGVQTCKFADSASCSTVGGMQLANKAGFGSFLRSACLRWPFSYALPDTCIGGLLGWYGFSSWLWTPRPSTPGTPKLSGMPCLQSFRRILSCRAVYALMRRRLCVQFYHLINIDTNITSWTSFNII